MVNRGSVSADPPVDVVIDVQVRFIVVIVVVGVVRDDD